MDKEEPHELADLLDQIQFYLAQPLDFTKTDSDTTQAKVHIYLGK